MDELAFEADLRMNETLLLGEWEGTGLGKAGPAYIGLGYSHTQKMRALWHLPSLA